MNSPRPSSRIHPKISTMPRQRSEAAHYLDIYKLTIEKKRLKQELTALDQRRDRLQERLQILDQQIADLNHTAQRLQEPRNASEPNSVVYPPAQYPDSQDPENFQTVTLDY
ncbi:MAG: hypothetical protein F6K42_02980 [Leptolyngbya sp. SIO1D8]|nr:hypothetical protein [Leptolyngbya sp. SIO1D8]